MNHWLQRSIPTSHLGRSTTLRRALGCILALVFLCFAAVTATWPFLGDSSYIHYVVFLTRHGMAPYRDIFEMNMPLTYLLEHLAMSLFGAGSPGWRLFDLSLLVIAIVSCISILKPQGRLAGLFAGVLFAVIHGQDGVMMAGERDLEVAVFQVAGVACLLAGLRLQQRSSPKGTSAAWFFISGALLATACCIKPTSLPLAIAVLAWFVYLLRRRNHPTLSPLSLLLCGCALPIAASAMYLWSYDAFQSFWQILNGLVRYHATLDRKPLSFLLGHAFSPVLPLFCLSLLLFLSRGKWRNENEYRPLLVLGTLAAWLGYALQRKGFSYQRYPFLLFLLLLISSDLFQPTDDAAWKRLLASATISFGILSAIFFTYKASTYTHTTPNKTMLADIASFGGPKLSHQIQCMDTAGGCIEALYRSQLVQSTGFLYDCYFVDGSNKVVQDLRSRFEAEFQKNPPQLLLITDSVCYGQKRSFDKFASWPTFTQKLNEQYILAQERHFTNPEHYWSRGDIPYSYRIYTRKPETAN